jgi:predicted dehydrogenase
MSKKTRIAVAGFGLVGRRHAEVVRRSTDATLAAIVEPSSEGQKAASLHDAPVFGSLETLLSDARPDGIVLATPTPMHLEQGLAYIEAGCPVLIEKPIAVSSSEARLLTTAADKAGVPLIVGHHRRHNGMVKAAKAALTEGAIGDIRAIQATCWFYKPDAYFDVAPWRKKKGAGPISVNLVHDVDLLRHFCGDVASVQAISVPSRRGFENEDLATAVLTFQSGAIATISVSDSIVAPWSWELTARENPAYPATSESCYLIGGSKGGLSLPDLRVWSHSEVPDWWRPISAQTLTCSMDDPLAVQMQHFVDVIAGREVPLVTGHEGLKSLEVVEAVALSSASGREIKLAEPDRPSTQSLRQCVKISDII